jgi:hypothetical protein
MRALNSLQINTCALNDGLQVQIMAEQQNWAMRVCVGLKLPSTVIR